MKTITLILIGIIAFHIGRGQVQNLSLKQCMELAHSNNISVKVAELEVQKACWNEKEIKSRGRPHLTLANTAENYMKLPVLIVPGEIFGQPEENIPVEFGTKYSVSTSLQASQLLLDFSYFTSKKIADHYTRIAEFNESYTKEKIAFEVAQIYYYILAIKEQQNVIGKSCSNYEKLYKINKLNLENGLLNKVDLQKIEVQLNNLWAQNSNSQIQLESHKKQLMYLLNMASNKKIVLSDSIQNTLVPCEIADHLSCIPEIKILNTKKEISELSIQANKEQSLPTLSAFGSYSFQAQRDQFDMLSKGSDKWFEVGVVGLSLNIPIMAGFERNARLKKSIIELEQLNKQKEDLFSRYKTEISIAKGQLIELKNNLVVQTQNVDLATNVYELTGNTYQQGITPLTEVIMAQNNILNNKLQYLQSLLRLRLAELKFLQASGNFQFLTN